MRSTWRWPARSSSGRWQPASSRSTRVQSCLAAHGPAGSSCAGDACSGSGARKRLAEFGALWRNPAVPDRLSEEARHEILARIDVQGSQALAVHPQPNENAWLLGLAALLQEQHVGMVGARGFDPAEPSSSVERLA